MGMVFFCTSRAATGYTIVSLDEGDAVADISIVRRDENGD